MDSAVLAAGLCGRLWASVRPLWASVGICGLWELPGTSGKSFLRVWHLYQEATFPFAETAVLIVFVFFLLGSFPGSFIFDGFAFQNVFVCFIFA